MSELVGIALVDEHPNGYAAHVRNYLEQLGVVDFRVWAFRTYEELLAALHWGDLDMRAQYFFIGRDGNQFNYYAADRKQASSDGCPERVVLGNFFASMYGPDRVLF